MGKLVGVQPEARIGRNGVVFQPKQKERVSRRIMHLDVTNGKKIHTLRRSERAKYDENYFDNYYWAEDLPHDPDHTKRFSFLAKLIFEHFEFSSFLDLGFGMGHLEKFMNVQDIDIFCIEVSQVGLEKAVISGFVQSNKAVVGEGRCLPIRSDMFDLVFCSDVLEHIPIFDIQQTISELVRVTRRYLCLTINLDHIYDYHPTIMPREEWEQKFKIQAVTQCKKLENQLKLQCHPVFPEYDFFVLQKLWSS